MKTKNTKNAYKFLILAPLGPIFGLGMFPRIIVSPMTDSPYFISSLTISPKAHFPENTFPRVTLHRTTFSRNKISPKLISLSYVSPNFISRSYISPNLVTRGNFISRERSSGKCNSGKRVYRELFFRETVRGETIIRGIVRFPNFYISNRKKNTR
jgi:hypothetical protein